MSRRQLPPELIALIHHVELTDARWQDRLAEQLVLATLRLCADSASLEHLRRTLRSDYAANLDDDAVNRAIQRLSSQKKVHEVGAQTFRLAETARVDLELRLAEAAALEARACTHFLSILANEVPDSSPEGQWIAFCSQCLDPLITELGVRTYDLVSGRLGTLEASRSANAYLDSFPETQRAGVRRAVSRFIDPTEQDSRHFVLQRLHSYLLTIAANLTEQTLARLASSRGAPIQLQIFVDTNFLFSILDLHENPANAAAVDLLALLRQLTGRVSAQLYVFPLTIDETRRTLGGYESHLSNMPLTPRLGRIATVAEADLSGITLRYIQAVREANHRLSAKEYFAPYLSDLLAILRSKGVELYNENVDSLTTEQEVIDDILEQQEFERRRFRERPKNYEALRHDIALWHFVARKRPDRVDSPVEARYWIVSIDYRFLGFDSYRQRKAGGTLPLCIHPAVLLQMLQLWLPRDPQLDTAMLHSIRALLPQHFDSDAEEVTIRILRSLSRYEDVDDLPEDAVEAILVNRALRARMKTTGDIDDQIQLVREAITAEVARARDELEAERQARRELARQLEHAQSTHRQEVASVVSERAAVELQRQELEALVRREREERRMVESRLGQAEKNREDREREVAVREQTRARRFHRASFAAVLSVLLLGVSLLIPIVARALSATASISTARAILLCGAAMILGLLMSAERVGGRFAHVKNWGPYLAVHRARKWLLALTGAVLLGLLTNVIWEIK